MGNSIYLGGGIKSAFCGGNVKEIYQGTNKLFPSGGEVIDINYVQIGNLLWQSENLDLKLDTIDIGAIREYNVPCAWYYKNDEQTYGKDGLKYGLLYNWYCIAEIENSGKLPSGWRVPTEQDYQELFATIGGQQYSYQKLAGSWARGSDQYGFNAPPSGARWAGNFGRMGISFYGQCKTEYDSNSGKRMWIDIGSSGFDKAEKKYGQSIRLCKDA